MTSEELKALLAREAEINASEEDHQKTLAARKRAAKDWVQHYVYVTKFKAELIEGGLKPEEFTADHAVKALVAKWEETAEVRSTDAI